MSRKPHPDNWIALASDCSWRLTHPRTGRRVIINGQHGLWWVEWHAGPFDPFDEAATSDRSYTIVDGFRSEEAAERYVRAIGRALGAVEITDDEGELLRGRA